MMEKNKIKFDVSFRYEEGNTEALQQVQGEIKEGQCIVLCGASGCGKSTLLRCFNCLIPNFYEGKLKGVCILNDKNTQELSIGDAGEIAAYVFQDPRSQFFTMNSSTEVAFGLENYGYSHEEIVRRVDSTFQDLGLEYLKDRNVFELSSGERQLVAIASAWALQTDIFLLDEPTANLDYAAIEKLRELLQFLKSKNKTIVVNEHRLYYLSEIADEYWRMDAGQIVERITAEAMVSMTKPELEERSLRVVNTSQIELESTEDTKIENDVLSLAHISFAYNKEHVVLNDISLTACVGEVVALIGANGSGKTTLGKLIAGLHKKTSGEIRFRGNVLNEKQMTQNSLFIMQEVEFQFFSNTVWNELLYGKRNKKKSKQEVEMLLKEFGMWECRNRHPFSLSGGQMQKLTLMLGFLSEKPIIVLDEPTAGLDYQSLQSSIRLIRKMKEKKVVFIITHDMELIAQACDRYICLGNGHIQKECALKKQKQLQELEAYMAEKFKNNGRKKKIKVEKKGSRVDLRTKLLYLAVIAVIAAGANVKQMEMASVLMIMFAIGNRKWKTAVGLGTMLGAIFALYHLVPGVLVGFLVNYLPRFALLGLAISSFMGDGDVMQLMAALRKIHVPERAIMACSVVFRFFPALKKDIKIMNQSIKTRNFFDGIGDKLRNLPAYLEVLIVPMIFRVLRIAQTLSASVETRGADLKRKRYAYLEVKFATADYIWLFVLAMFLVLYFVIM